ncbi:hypothetical protein FH972_027058 [Carpinus fangiana]|uniref:Uncharacterized protein n=1 Tax=Carpinus fangiana TaxID=176857 RepID=A0A5N6L5U1_9ROSI|nr:hypothetical protein FH972_027058 [Carpinus fangiana]
MAPEGRVNRVAPNITRIIQILKQIINEKYKEGKAHDLKVSAEKMRSTSFNAMIDVIALYLDYEKGKEVSTKTHKVSWNGSDVHPISSIKDLIPEEYMEGETNGWSDFTANYQKPKNTRYMIFFFFVGDEGEREKKWDD